MTKKRGMKKIIFLALIAVFLYSFCEYAHAFRMNIDPPRIELDISPGDEEGGYIKVQNYDEEEAIHVKVYVNDLVYLPDGTNDFLPEGSTPWSVSDWLKIGPTEFDLPPMQEGKVRYVLNVPKDAKGGRYGIAFFEVSPTMDELKGRTGAMLSVRLGSIFLITVKGTQDCNAVIKDMVVTKPDKEGNIEVRCTISNGGNVLIRPNGPVKIIDSAKNEVAAFQMNTQKSGILPGTSREFSEKYDSKKLTPGEYFVQVILDYGGEDYLGAQAGFTVK